MFEEKSVIFELNHLLPGFLMDTLLNSHRLKHLSSIGGLVYFGSLNLIECTRTKVSLLADD